MKAIFIFEGDLDSSHQCALSEVLDVLAQDWGLTSYLDDVIEDKDGEQCGHGNSWSANCSDCDEQELHDRVLRESLGEVYNMLTECLGDIIHDKVANQNACEDEYKPHGRKLRITDHDLIDAVEKDIYSRIAWQEKESEVE